MKAPSFPVLWFRRTVLLLAAGGASLLLAAAPAPAPADPASDPVVELPKFVVTDTRELPPPESWRYAEIPGFEILTNSSDREAQRLIKDFQLFNQAIDIVWPGLQRRGLVPTSLILCARGGKFDSFVPVAAGKAGPDQGLVSLFLKDDERSAIVLDMEARILFLSGTDTSAATGAGSDSGGAGGDAGMEVDHYKQLYREYVHYLLARQNPRPAAWLEEGLAQLLMGMKFDRKHIEFGKVEDPNVVSIAQSVAAAQNADATANGDAATATAPAEDSDFNKALQRKSLINFPELFAVEHDSPIARNPVGSTWAKQSYAFVHMCLYGRGQRYQKGFFQLLFRLAKEPLSEPMFKECFGKDYKGMLLEIRGYVDYTDYKSMEFNAKKGESLPDPPTLVLREATESQVGRIKGESMILAGRAAEARTTLIAPYIRGERDPRLLGALGLYERAAGNNERAKKFLEAAAAAKLVRPRVYSELARVRYELALAQPLAPEGRLNAAQAASVLTPLFTARSQPPPMPEVYELIAETWMHCELTPTRENLAVLYEGIRFFPRHAGFVYNTAQLSVNAGLMPEASRLADLGLKVTGDAALKARFTQLKASLPPLPPEAAPAAAPAQPTAAKKS